MHTLTVALSVLAVSKKLADGRSFMQYPVHRLNELKQHNDPLSTQSLSVHLHPMMGPACQLGDEEAGTVAVHTCLCLLLPRRVASVHNQERQL